MLLQKKISLFIIGLSLGILFSNYYSNKYIHLSFMNATDLEAIEISYSIDGQPEKIERIERGMISFDFFVHQVDFGKHSINFNCKELHIEKRIDVFTFKNNYLDLEIQNNLNQDPEFLVRYSWFPLVYM